MFQLFASLGLGATATRYVAEFKTIDTAKTGRIISLTILSASILGAFFTAALYFAAPWLAARPMSAPHLGPSLRLGAPLLCLYSIIGAQTGALAGFGAFRTTASVNTVVAILSFPLVVGGALLWSIPGAMVGLVLAGLSNCVANHFALASQRSRYGVRMNYGECWGERRILARFSIPSVLGNAMAGPVAWGCQSLLATQPGGYAALGAYNAIVRVKQIPESAASMLLTPLLPLLSEKFGNNQTASYNRTLILAFCVGILTTMPFALLLSAVPSLALMPFGRQFSAPPALIQLMMLHGLLIGLYAPMGGIFGSTEKMWVGALYNVVLGTLQILLAFCWIPRIGATGLAAAIVTSVCFVSTAFVWYIYRDNNSPLRQLPTQRMLALLLFSEAVCVLSSRLFAPAISAFVAIVLVGGCAFYVVSILRRARQAPRELVGSLPLCSER